jgi:hypothetical protein
MSRYIYVNEEYYGSEGVLSFSESPLLANPTYCSASTRHVTRAQHITCRPMAQLINLIGTIRVQRRRPCTDTSSMVIYSGRSLRWARLKPPGRQARAGQCMRARARCLPCMHAILLRRGRHAAAIGNQNSIDRSSCDLSLAR